MHASLVSSWERLRVDLPDPGNQTWEDLGRLSKVAWLILLSKYECNARPCCYYQASGDHESQDVLSLSIDGASTLIDQVQFLRTTSVNVKDQQVIKHAMLCENFDEEQHDWIARIQPRREHADLKMVLALDSSCPRVEHRDRRSLYLLFDENQDFDALGRAETLKTILHAMIDSSTTPIGDVDLLSDHDRRRILAWNEPGPGPPSDMTIPSAFLKQVEERPDEPAVYAWDGEMTYEELDVASSTISVHLRNGTTDMVLFNMTKSKWALVAALAILKSGKAIVPIDQSWPDARLNQIVEITRANLVICDEHTKGRFDTTTIREILVPLPSKSLESQQSCSSETTCTTNDLAFVLFSSGSTGVPKGMLRQHGTACTGSFAHAKAMHLDGSSRVLQFANHVFDVAMLDFFTTLLMGGCVCIPSESDRKNNLAEFIMRSQANWALLTPTVADLLDPSLVPSLQFITLGGESINKATLQKWLSVCRVGINYGSAEVDVTHARDVLDVIDVSNVGQRLPSCTAYVVDPEDPIILLPVGAVGELVISGPTMAREYLNNPAKTAEVFLESPERWLRQGIIRQDSPRWMSRIYRMGDLVRQRSDGSFEFVSRKDFQVKVSGQKVELGDIESKLLQHPAIKHAVALYPTQGPYAKRLVALVQAVDDFSHHSRHGRAANSALSFHTMTKVLSHKLPPFMLPNALIVLKTMPYTATMKIDRNRLKNWLLEFDTCCGQPAEVLHISTALNGPRLLSEEHQAIKLSSLVADVVSSKHSAVWMSISGHDNKLSDIGINSAQTMRLASFIRQSFGSRVLVEMLGDKEMTIRKLAAILQRSETQSAELNPTSTPEGSVDFLKSQVADISQSILQGQIVKQSCPQRHVFLTGATGYLGTQILVHLLQSTNVGSITVLVRNAGVHDVFERVKHALGSTKMIEACHKTLRVWSGDLSKTHVGLSDEHWREFIGSNSMSPYIDTIIHCGAVVNWTKGYKELEAANVTSTEQLLRVTLASPCIKRFVFISGGRYPNPAQDASPDLDALYAEAASGTGYAQTKFVAEQLVKRIGSSTDHVRSISVVNPAYLIGSSMTGLANQDDYLWRIIWASIRIGAFNADETDHWLFVSEAETVANDVVTLALRDTQITLSNSDLTILDGLSIHTTWQIVSSVLGVTLTPVSGQVWLEKVKCDMAQTSDHLLWPLADILDSSYGLLTPRCTLAADVNPELAAADRIELAMRKNLECLHSVGFFD